MLGAFATVVVLLTVLAVVGFDNAVVVVGVVGTAATCVALFAETAVAPVPATVAPAIGVVAVPAALTTLF